MTAREIDFATIRQDPLLPGDRAFVFRFDTLVIPNPYDRSRQFWGASQWGAWAKEIEEVSFQWFLVSEAPFGVYNPGSGNMVSPTGSPFMLMPPDDPPGWTTGCTDFSILTNEGYIRPDGRIGIPARISVPIDQLPPQPVTLMVRHVVRAVRPRRYRGYEGAPTWYPVAAISGDNVAPLVSLWSPQESAYQSPVVFTGLTADPSVHGSEQSGLAACQLSVVDLGKNPWTHFDFSRQRWVAAAGDAEAMPVELDYTNSNAANFRAEWDDHASGSGEYLAVIEVVDNRGNVGRVE